MNFDFKRFIESFVGERKLEGVRYYIGQIRPIGKIFTEKGVDVRIGIDLVEGAYEDRYDRAILISSDGDLAPAVEMVTRKGKKVEIVGFEHKPSYSLIQKTNTYHSVKKLDLDRFMPEKIA